MAERAFVDLSAWRKVRVAGTDAAAWLHDLLTADIAGLSPGQGCRSLLLSSTGHIRADVQVIRRDHDLVLAQDPIQPDHVGLLLHPYTLSSDVSLEDATADLALITVPGRAGHAVGIAGASSPSIFGAGVDALVPSGKPAWRLEAALVHADLAEADPASAETWRVLRGFPRMGRDFDQRSLPAEAGLEATIDRAKGCFLGQESVARVRNLGHPPTVLRHLRVEGAARPGDVLLRETVAVGAVTSVAEREGRGDAVVLARVRWDAREASLTLPDGRALVSPDPAY
jgi:hypothetical protein